MIQITRRERFNAAHRLFNPKWSVEKNWEIFGPCSRIHGHNWELFVTVEGEIQEETGFVIDLKLLSRIVKDEITSKIDHTYLNEDVDFLKGQLASAENLAIGIWNILQPILKGTHGVDLYSIRLKETENHFVEYFGK